MAATPWATIQQIAASTGRTVDATTRTLAAQAIEMQTGLIEEVERTDISDRDRYWLKLAVAYQAAWLTAQPDYLERNAVAVASQDGQSASAGNPEWLTLSPQARKCIRRLSWRGVRTVATAGAKGTVVNVNSEEFDDSLPWKVV